MVKVWKQVLSSLGFLNELNNGQKNIQYTCLGNKINMNW